MLKTLARLIRLAVILAVLSMLVSIAIGTPWIQRKLNPIHYVDLITVYSRRHSLDPFLVAAIMRVESRFQPDAVSSKGARGLMQLMPDTGRWAAGLGSTATPTTSIRFEVNIRSAHGISQATLEPVRGQPRRLWLPQRRPSNVDRWLSSEMVGEHRRSGEAHFLRPPDTSTG